MKSVKDLYNKFKKNINIKNGSVKSLKLYNKLSLLRYTKIRTRLITSYILLILIPMTCIGVFSYYKSSNTIKDKISNYSSEITRQISSNEKAKLDTFQRVADQIIFSSSVQSSLADFDKYDFIAKDAFNKSIGSYSVKNSQSSGKIDTLALYTNSKKIIGVNTLSEEDIKSINEEAIKNNGAVSWSIHNSNSGSKQDKLIVLSKLINSIDTFKPLGVFYLGISESLLSEGFNKTNLGDDSSVTILDTDSTVISSKDKEILGTKYENKEIMDDILKNEERVKSLNENEQQDKRVLSMNINSKPYLITYSPVENTNWYVVASIPISYINSDSRSLGYSIVVIGIGVLIVAMFAALIISNSIAVPMSTIVQLMKKAKDGDLNITITDKSKDEVGEVAKSFNDMIDKLRFLIKNVKGISQNVSEDSQAVSKFSENSLANSQQVGAIMEEISVEAEKQVIGVKEGAEYIEELSSMISNISDDMKSILVSLQDVDYIKNEAYELIDFLNNKTIQTIDTSNSIVTSVSSLNENMEEISGIMDMINSIAEQTSLLSLNAAIEAARAGESGRGFAVVADEIRKLAMESKEATQQISTIITNLKSSNDSVINQASIANSVINEQIDIVGKSASAFHNVFVTTDNVSEKIKNLASLIQEILENREKAIKSIYNISTISGEIAASTEQVNATSQEQIARIQQMASLAENLNNMVRILNESIDIFRFEES
ncbi:MAG: methyl-accepting chemotaxis protein [Clostridiaceae bacterium]